MALDRPQTSFTDENEFGEQEALRPSEKTKAEELQGKLRKDHRDDKLDHTVLDADKKKIDKAKVLSDAINNNITSFTPDLSFEQMVKDYKTAKKILGESLIRELTGYEPGYIEKNINIPEFQRMLRDRIQQNIEQLKDEGLLDKYGSITNEGYEYSALALISEELDRLETHSSLGEKTSKKKNIYGEKQDLRNYKAGDRYKDLELQQSTKRSIRRGHETLQKQDLVTSERESKGNLSIIYAIDASGSMKGPKINTARKAGIALAYKALKNKDKAGLAIFNSKIEGELSPTNNFMDVAKQLSNIRTTGETDIALGIEKSLHLLEGSKGAKHIVLLTDALQTRGKKPDKEVLEAVSKAANTNTTISVIGINLNKMGEKLARKIVDLSKGTLYSVKNLEDIDQIIIEDYYRSKS